MYFFLSKTDDPYYNLALEEYLLLHAAEDVLLCYINEPTVVIGRFQVPYREVNADLLHQEEIKLLRRLSGGGTVFHDRGNLNYAYISHCADSHEEAYAFFNRKTELVLRRLGLPKLTFQRNNIFCEGRKISGVAQYKRGRRMVHHGTLLVNADLELLRKLFVSKDYYRTKGLVSVPSSVSNLQDFLPITMEAVLAVFEKSCVGDLSVYWNENSVAEKALYYKNREWTFGKSPQYSLSKDDFSLTVEHGKISRASGESCAHLLGKWHDIEEIGGGEVFF